MALHHQHWPVHAVLQEGSGLILETNHSVGVGETSKISGRLIDIQLKRIVSIIHAVLSHIGDLLITNRESNKRLKQIKQSLYYVVELI